jgi:prepilin-type N-terminal cleavage/methylation domain-containing protein
MKPKLGEKGFTLIELLVGISIAAFVVGAASMTTITMMRLTPQTNNWAIALHQVQNAGHWISRDIQMSQGDITVGDGNPTFLTLTLPEWDDNLDEVVNKTVVYEFEDMSGDLKMLMRNNQTDGEQMMIAEYISTNNNDTIATYNSDNLTLTFTITATSGDVPVTRDYEAMQRVLPAPSP